jgi:hypothetical protein
MGNLGDKRTILRENQMTTKEQLIQSLMYSEKQSKVFWFICRWWFAYGVFGGIVFICGLIAFVPLFCDDCRPSDLFSNGFFDLMLTLIPALNAGALLGAFVGLVLGFVHAVIIRVWAYFPVENIRHFQLYVIVSNLSIPTGLMVFSTIFLVSLTTDHSQLPTILYLPVLAYAIVVIVGLLVSRKFLNWWI